MLSKRRAVPKPSGHSIPVSRVAAVLLPRRHRPSAGLRPRALGIEVGFTLLLDGEFAARGQRALALQFRGGERRNSETYPRWMNRLENLVVLGLFMVAGVVFAFATGSAD